MLHGKQKGILEGKQKNVPKKLGIYSIFIVYTVAAHDVPFASLSIQQKTLARGYLSLEALLQLEHLTCSSLCCSTIKN